MRARLINPLTRTLARREDAGTPISIAGLEVAARAKITGVRCGVLAGSSARKGSGAVASGLRQVRR